MWVKEYHPGLRFSRGFDGEILEGEFRFTAAWDESRRIYLINPVDGVNNGLIWIQDSYKIKIELRPTGAAPKLFETGRRILDRAQELSIESRDLHIYETGEACPAGIFDTVDITGIPEFIDRPVMQYFYDQSYHERYGRWPRGEYLHGLMGVIENYFEQGEGGMENLAEKCLTLVFEERDKSQGAVWIRTLITNPQRVQGHWACLCGSGKEFKVCHRSLFRGLWFLHEYFKKKRKV